MAFNSLRWLVTASLFSFSSSLVAGEYDEDIVHPHEPAMADIVQPQTLNDIRDIMIKESIKVHGFCACPYSTDALGGQCGSLSAYYHPWNKILCYRRDITNDMVHFYCLRHALDAYQAQIDRLEAKKQAEEAAQNPEKEAAETKKRSEITANYFRNSAKPLPNTMTTPSNVPISAQDVSKDAGLTTNYFKSTVPLTPASNSPSLPNIITPPTPATPNY